MAIVSICSYKFSIFKIFIFLNWFMFIDRCSITKESFVKSLFARHQFIYATDLRFVSRCPKWRRSFRPKKPEMFQYAEASIVFGVILSKRCQTMNEAQPTQTWSNKYGIQLMALFQENQIVSYSQNNCGGVIMICER